MHVGDRVVRWKRQLVARSLVRLIEIHLRSEIGDPVAANVLASRYFELGLDWTPPKVRVDEVESIAAFSFGNRSPGPPIAGNQAQPLAEPGPVNELIADATARLHEMTSAKIYAQWEVARILLARHHLDEQVVSIEPIVQPDGTIRYLSTKGVAGAIAARAQTPENLGTVAVVAHRDHAWRCVQASSERFVRAGIVDAVRMPTAYDGKSGQVWTRHRDLYLVYDILARAIDLKNQLEELHLREGD